MAQTVLIVDDHPSFRSTAKILLESEGFEVIGEAQDGASAIEAIQRLVPEVVLLDVQLPDMDGFTVARAVLADGAASAIVLTSSRDGFDFGSLVSESGARGFIPKGELSGEAIAELLR
jgi:DNA-binding NarL/FixJ family response regulator